MKEQVKQGKPQQGDNQPDLQANGDQRIEHKGAQAAARTASKPMKVLSTSLGLALAANLLAIPAAGAEGTDTGKAQPKLVEWSSEAVKGYFDPSIDWNLVLPSEKKDQQGTGGAAAASGTAGTTGTAGGTSAATGGGTNTVVVHSGGGFGWDDLLLYHLLFNGGGVFSTRSWSQSHQTVYVNNSQPYQPRSYSSDTFQSKPVAGSTVRAPQTSTSSGSFSTSKGASSSGGTAGVSSGSSKGSTAATGGGSSASSGTNSPSTSTSSGSFSTSSSSKSSSTSSGSIGGKSSGFSSSSSSSSGS